MRTNIIITICCIALCFAFSGVASAKGNPHDPGSSLEAEAYVTCYNEDTAHVWLDLECNSDLLKGIYGNGSCTVKQNPKHGDYKLSCKAMGAAVQYGEGSVVLDNGLSVDIEQCVVKHCIDDGPCVMWWGYGQATISANYDDEDHANVNLTCFFPNFPF